METESVWEYPRPPRVEPSTRRVRVVHRGITVADSVGAFRVLETSHPPAFYIPAADVRTDLLSATRRRTFCEFKGYASYADLVLPDATVRDATWFYPDPTAGYERITGCYSFYPGRVDECTVDGERVTAQASDFYGGWITAGITGPFKT